MNGIQVSKRVTIREGWTISMVAKELERTLGIGAEFFEEASYSEILLKKWKITGKSFEGYLRSE